MIFYRKNKLAIWGAIGSALIIGLAFTIPYLPGNRASLADNLAKIQVYLTAVGFLVIFETLIITISQFRKSMAKPNLRLALTENGETETNIQVSKNKELNNIELDFWVINDGNAIAKMFQIELKIPGLYNPHFVLEGKELKCSHRPLDENIEILSLCNNEKIICFVNNPEKISDVRLSTDPKGYGSFGDFPIYYKIIGDWAEPKEGTLKVHVKKD